MVSVRTSHTVSLSSERLNNPAGEWEWEGLDKLSRVFDKGLPVMCRKRGHDVLMFQLPADEGLGAGVNSAAALPKRSGFDKIYGMKKAVRIVRLDRSDELDFAHWLNTSPAEKLDTLQYLREMVYELKNESRKGLQRFLKVTRRKKS